MRRIVLDQLEPSIEASLLRGGALVVVRGIGRTELGDTLVRIEIAPPPGSTCGVVLVDCAGGDEVRVLRLPGGASFEYNLGNDEMPAWMWRAPEEALESTPGGLLPGSSLTRPLLSPPLPGADR